MPALAFLAQAAAAFNLICTGTSSLATEPSFSLVIRVDLGKQRYCMDGCDHTLPIALVTDTEIVFANDPPGANRITRRVSRENGSYQAYTKVGAFFESADVGRCERATFTGFPARRF